MINNYNKSFNTTKIMPLCVVELEDLSLEAKGLWAFLNSKSEDWQLTAESIAAEILEDEEKIKSVLRELATSGLLSIQKTTRGTFIYTLNMPRNKRYLERR